MFPRHRPLFVPIAISSRRRGSSRCGGGAEVGRCVTGVCFTRHRPRVPHRPPQEPVDWIPVMCDCALCPCYSSMETPPAPWSVRSYDLSNIIPRAWLINGGSRLIYGLGRREMHRDIHSSNINLLAVKLWNQSRTRYRGMKLARLVLRVLQVRNHPALSPP